MSTKTDSVSVAFTPTLPWWGRIGLLWLLFVPICAIIYVLCLPIAPNDFWYHARAGLLISELGHIPTTNLSSTGQPLDKPYFYQSWIAEWVFYQVLARGGLAWITILRALCVGGTYGLIALAAYRRALRIGIEKQMRLASDTPITGTIAESIDTRAARVAACGTLIAFLMSVNNLDVRPQLLSLPLFALFTFLIFEWPYTTQRGRVITAAVLAIATVIWVNTHGAFFTGLFLLAGIFLSEMAYRLIVQGKSGQKLSSLVALWGSALPSQACSTGILALGLAVAASLLNQRGAYIYSYVMALGNNEIGQKYIQEWQAPEFALAEWHSIVFFLSPLLLIVPIFRAIRRNSTFTRNTTLPPASSSTILGQCGLRLGEFAVLLVLFALLAVRDKRSIMWYALFVAPALASVLAMASRSTESAKHNESASKGAQLSKKAASGMNLALVCFLLFLPVPALPWIKPLLDLPRAFQARFAPTPRAPFPTGFPHDPPLLLERTTPVEAADFLRAHPPQKRLFNDMVQGSYLMWALPPHGFPSADPRIELYSTAFWEDYLQLCDGPQNAVATLEKRGYSDALLDTEYQPKLIKRLAASPAWRLIFKHRTVRLFRHNPVEGTKVMARRN